MSQGFRKHPQPKLSPAEGLQVAVYQQQRVIKIASRSVKCVVAFIVAHEKIACDALAIHFVTPKKIAHLHNCFFDDPTPTDCITFPYEREKGAGPQFLGDIFVCPAVAQEYVSKKGGDLYEELTLYVLHGLLHLQGYDDMNSQMRQMMRREERRLMSLIKKQKLLLC